MSNSSRFIYALYYDHFGSSQDLIEGPDEVIFYIGRTAYPDRRLKQHRYEAKQGTEDKYAFVRDLEEKSIEWDLKILFEVEQSDSRPWEYWYVIEMIRLGMPLKNMRYGDFKQVPTNRLRTFAADSSVQDVDDLKERLDEEDRKDAPNNEHSVKVQERAILKSLRWLREERETNGGKLNIYDLGEGTEEVKADYYMNKKEVAHCLTPAFKETIQQLIEKFPPA